MLSIVVIQIIFLGVFFAFSDMFKGNKTSQRHGAHKDCSLRNFNGKVVVATCDTQE